MHWTRGLRTAAFAAVASIVTIGEAGAQTITSWAVARNVNQMDGAVRLDVSRPAATTVQDSLGRAATPRLYLRCTRAPNRQGEVSIFVGFPNQLFTSFGDNIVRARIDDEEIIQDNWEPSDTRSALFWGRAEAVFRLREAQVLHLEFAPPMTGRQYARFNLPNVAQAVAAVVNACTLQGEELDRYNTWATEQLRQDWIKAFQSSYSGDYSHVYLGLMRVGAISGPPLRPGSNSDRPIPAEALAAALMQHMQTSGRCIYQLEPKVCPLNLPTGQASIYFRSGDESVRPNVQWTEMVRTNQTEGAN